MCGICGQLNLNFESPVDRDMLEAMNNTLFHRGPNDCGVFISKNVGLAMRRLSIIDVATGKQPISNEEKTVWVVFNGEIYNYIDLRKQLLIKGHRFRTQSDTECIVHLYEEEGTGFVNHLEGMFAIAIWDIRKNQLTLVRDRLGIKPLFYGEYKGKFLFSSEIKAILADKQFPRRINNDGLAAYFTLGYIPGPYTIFQNIKKLLPGHVMTVEKGKVKEKRYWDIFFKSDRTKSEEIFIEEFVPLLEEAVQKRLMSEVPLGAFLSGGIDSGTIVAMMSRVTSSPVKTVSIGFGGDIGGYLDERGLAKLVANRFRTDHMDFVVFPKPEGLVEKIISAFDEPFADDSVIPSYFVCKSAKEKVAVALSGLGGDEVFGGYERYLGLALSRFYEKLPFFVKEKILRKIIENLPERADGHYTVNHLKRFVRSSSHRDDKRYFSYISMISGKYGKEFFNEPEKFIDSFKSVEEYIMSYFNSSNAYQYSGSKNASDFLNKAFFFDMKIYLPDDILTLTDRMSMINSLEVRVPFIDHKLVEFSATIPAEMKLKWFRKKHLLKKAVSNLLPREILEHRKQGFASPMATWLQSDLKSYVWETLSKRNLGKHELFNPHIVHNILKEHDHRVEQHDKLIWSLIIFQKWFDAYMI
jgi:asparagine synthase (glutamine-hydrolysing)